LFTSRWRKYLGKVCNLSFTIPLGSDVWDMSNFEPLISGFYLPLSRHKPWNLRGTPMLERVERMLCDLPPPDTRWGRSVLRELLFQARSLETMPVSLVQSMLYSDWQRWISYCTTYQWRWVGQWRGKMF
jgi:hypothetical protein